jgi:hypothetical protein
MQYHYQIRVLFQMSQLWQKKARPDRKRSERAHMIRLELGTATGAQSGPISGAGNEGKSSSCQWFGAAFQINPRRTDAGKVPANTGAKSAKQRLWLGHFKAILGQKPT